jgi:hypothetical protein
MHISRSIWTLILLLGLTAVPAVAGPPLICHSIDIGSRHSLPWLVTERWNGADPTYNVVRLIDDVLDILVPDAPVRVRMETLRRAAIYSARETGLSDRLTVRLVARAMDATAAGTPDPSAWFDAGYFVETLRDAAKIYPKLQGPERDAWMIRIAPQIDGLAWIRTAVRMGDAGVRPVVAVIEEARTKVH